MKTKDLLLLGVPLGAPMGEAFKFISSEAEPQTFLTTDYTDEHG